ncbi:hypothetical protein [Candidatus Electronema sp. PJ]|uniref:hypothetical protein n=1 Tax=Candidatus Electronema sp. PJ TaxID=3401572 RepID=UPI003AA8B689
MAAKEFCRLEEEFGQARKEFYSGRKKFCRVGKEFKSAEKESCRLRKEFGSAGKKFGRVGKESGSVPKEFGRLQLLAKRAKLEHFVRALLPYPCAFRTYLGLFKHTWLRQAIACFPCE